MRISDWSSDVCSSDLIVGQLLVFRAQAPAGRRVALHACAQALVQQDRAGVEASAADQASVLFEGNVRFVVHDDSPVARAELPGTVASTAQRKIGRAHV